jgi:hypothetical protein
MEPQPIDVEKITDINVWHQVSGVRVLSGVGYESLAFDF